MSKRREARERKMGLRPTYVFKGARYTVRVAVRRGDPSQVSESYVVWDAKIRETVGDRIGSLALAERRAREMNEAVS
jgi:hypothetical protein